MKSVIWNVADVIAAKLVTQAYAILNAILNAMLTKTLFKFATPMQWIVAKHVEVPKLAVVAVLQ